MGMTYAKGDLIYEGKAKKLFATDDPERLIQYFKDDATAFNGAKKGTITNKGACNNAISADIYRRLARVGIENHFIERISERESLTWRAQVIPVEVVMRNRVAGSLSKRMGKPEGFRLDAPILEFYHKDDELGDPMINRSHIEVFKLATPAEVDHIIAKAFEINDWLVDFFDKIGIELVDYKLEFGRSSRGVLLVDEISPDGCRLWDKKTGEKMDKDRFRRDLGRLTEVYEEMRDRVLAARD